MTKPSRYQREKGRVKLYWKQVTSYTPTSLWAALEKHTVLFLQMSWPWLSMGGKKEKVILENTILGPQPHWLSCVFFRVSISNYSRWEVAVSSAGHLDETEQPKDLTKDTCYILSTWHLLLTTSWRRYSLHSSIILPLEQSNVRIEVLSVVLTVGPVASRYPMNTQRAQINSCRSETILFLVTSSLGIQDN